MEFAEVTQEVEIQRAVGIEDLDVGNELTPGRRRAAKLFDQDAAFDEMFGGRGASDSPLPIAPRNSIFFIKMPMLQVFFLVHFCSLFNYNAKNLFKD